MTMALTSPLRSHADPRGSTDAAHDAVSLRFGERAPFRWTEREREALDVVVEGSLPSWLRGQLVRTAPALFQLGDYAVDHWFDGLGLLYGFRFDARGVQFRQRLLDCRMRTELMRGEYGRASFGTGLIRPFWSRLRHPLPPVTDNTNVNVVPWDGAWLAMTETAHQHRIADDTLASTGLVRYRDELPRGVSMTAHPHLDARGAMVNVGTSYGRRNLISVLSTAPGSETRMVEGKLSLERPFYVHDFGLSARHAVLIGQPLTLRPLGMLWSNAPIAGHLRYEPERGTQLHLLDRTRGTFRTYETEALVCFHTVAAYDDGEDVVHDFLAFDDASVVSALSTSSLARGFPAGKMPRHVRARMRPGRTSVELETLSEARFDFPCPARASTTGAYSVCFGAVLDGDGAGASTGELIRVSLEDGRVTRFAEPDLVLGEPVLVRRPGALEADDGVVLSVGSSLTRDEAVLVVLDARTLEPLARARVGLALPLGFHGSFRRESS
jgi:beta,beta-carotene 9',10'-dioxygenase